jgi:drug/metabolite transporter superfamily protein YnfA
MDVVRTFAIYVAAAIGELAGTYCYWRWLKEKGPGWLPILGLLALLGYAVIQTYQPESKYSRVYAAQPRPASSWSVPCSGGG